MTDQGKIRFHKGGVREHYGDDLFTWAQRQHSKSPRRIHKRMKILDTAFEANPRIFTGNGKVNGRYGDSFLFDSVRNRKPFEGQEIIHRNRVFFLLFVILLVGYIIFKLALS